ncbi:NF038130 family PEP-CTERM protein [Limnofasciculus baicalensis]|uniref:NF038130 family PEP-CTERM protein n=1 Tax=Limnofasciculus baicalensis BBK-W-15 TaxID=2699891 RepID=A0AAE3KLF3_9CYAN|nr:NF038130 family PEP-CTERM protein [Limnofasciculus baicalensis]MCP2728475.1 NF038130 family PEP-CTERM protein [Limnofasciculus baicalensis BBK-W-15]
MTGTIKKFLLSASMVAGMSAIAIAPASAISITSATVTGTAPTDFEVWDVGGTPGIDCPIAATSCLKSSGTNVSNLINVLDGTLASPGGNIELFKSSEQLNLANFLAYDKVTSLKTDFSDGTSVTFSSLTAKDLFGAGLDTSYGASTVATQWFNDAFDANLQANNINENLLFTGLSLLTQGQFSNRADLYNAFLGAGGFQRAVDPNLAFVNKDGNNVKYGLAGHSDLLFYAPPKLKTAAAQFGLTLRASELVKLSFDGKNEIAYSFTGAKSNVASKDGSFNFTYDGDPKLVPPTTEKVPEPSAVLGLVAVGGLFVATRKLKKS